MNPLNTLAMTLGALDTDISPDFVYHETDANIAALLAEFDQTPKAFEIFGRYAQELSDYAYWYFLSTLWVSDNSHTELNEWRPRFLSGRFQRKTSLMKPSEVVAYDRLPKRITAYRAHRVGETDWISYTLDRRTAERFARERGVHEIVEYRLHKRDVLALFLRRGESELLMLWPKYAKEIARLEVMDS